MKIQDIILQYKQKLVIANYSPKTISAYLNALKLFLAYLSNQQLESVEEIHIQQYLFICANERKYSYSSMKQVMASIRFLYAHILNRAVPQCLNIRLKKPEKLPDVLSFEEVQKVFKVTNNLKHKCILMTLYSGGLRMNELLNLHIKDVDSDRMQIHIHSGKGQKDRFVMLSENLLRYLREYYGEYQPQKYLFEGQKGGQYSSSSVQNIMRSALKKAGVRKKATPHTLRHSFATHLLDNGTDIRYIQELLGHKHLETTRIYTHVSSYSINQIKSPLDSLDI